jgi:hypothetical protein
VADLAGSPDLLSKLAAPRVKKSIVHLSVAFYLPTSRRSPVQPTEKRGPHGTYPVPSYRSVRHPSSAKEEDFVSGPHRKTSPDRRLRIAKDVPVVRSNHSLLQAIVSGVWSVAARRLEGHLPIIGIIHLY